MTKQELLDSLILAKEALYRFYPEMDTTDFEMAIYSLEDDIADEQNDLC